MISKLNFAKQKRLSSLSYKHLGKKAGVENLSSFSICIEKEKTGEKVIAGINLANKLNILVTPSFLINGKLVVGEFSKQ